MTTDAPGQEPVLASRRSSLLETPPRRAGSVRRTVAIDSRRPRLVEGEPGGRGAVEVELTGADVRVDDEGRATTVDTLAVLAHLDGSSTITSIEPGAVSSARSSARSSEGSSEVSGVPGAAPDLGWLVGLNPSTGFRRAFAGQVGATVRPSSLLHAALDDWPGAALVSGYSLQRRALEIPGAPLHFTETDLAHVANVCAGWTPDGSIMVTVRDHGRVPAPLGPMIDTARAPLDQRDWHDLPALPARATRRRRRTDVWRVDGTTIGFETHFRDSYAEDDDTQSAVHEYLVTGTLDAATHTVVDVRADARVIPWDECPGALASATRIVGTPAHDLRARVRTDFVGPSTCTHLNDTLRTLEDLTWLAT